MARKRLVVLGGFTLLELIIVIIIIGVLATFGFTQYVKTIERGRTGEAKSNLGAIRTMATAYYQENGAYPNNAYLNTQLGLPIVGPACTNTTFYFAYTIDGAGTGTAMRCTSGGKTPNCTGTCAAYSLTLTIDGAPGGSW